MSRAYITTTHTTTVEAAVADGFNALEELASDVRDVVDAAEGGLAETARIQTLGETADTLESINGVTDIPEQVKGLEVTYTESYPRNKRRGPSRAMRCENAVALLRAAQSTLQDWLDAQDDTEEVAVDLRDEVEQIISDLDEEASNAEGCEFPGMFG